VTELTLLTHNGGVRSLEAWAAEMTYAAQIARGLAGTPFVPRALRVQDRGAVDVAATTANIAAALLTGRELGLEPMAALRSINMIDGTPALTALALRALVLNAGHDLWLEESTATRAIVNGQRRGTAIVQSSTWTMDRARTAGLAGKQNWRTQPTAMLIARATAECARLVAPEALLGMPYAAEELVDDAAPDSAPQLPARRPATRTARRRTIPAPAVDADQPDLDEGGSPHGDEPENRAVIAAGDSATPPPPEPPPDMITDAQLRALQAGFRELGISDRTDRLHIVRGIIGRHVTSAKELYRAEASTVLEDLAARKIRAAQADEDAQLDAAYWSETEADDPGHKFGEHATLDEPPFEDVPLPSFGGDDE
jgi:hypothetical protein